METNASVAPEPPPLTTGNRGHHHHSSQPQPHHHGTRALDSILVVAIPVISITLLLVCCLVIVMLCKMKSAKNCNSCRDSDSNNKNNKNNKKHSKFASRTSADFNCSPDVKGGCLYGGNLSGKPPGKLIGVQVFTYKELELATEGFSQANVIGNGGYGVVYRGILRDGTMAAIKVLHRQGKQGERAFRIEVDLLSRLHSPYMVELLGYCADQHHRILIFEFMLNGSVQRHLHPSPKQKSSLDWGTRLRIALDCARALEFLHEQSIPSIIHRDFKCSNILLDGDFRAKVSDFGLAKTGSDKINGQISTRVLGTTGYLAPEYASTGKLTTKSDVYSYGVVLLELLTGRAPVDSKRPPGEHVLVSWALPRLTNREKVVEMVDPVLRGQYSKKDLMQVAAIAAVCVQSEAGYRPLMTDVVQSLIPLVKSLFSVPSTSFRFQNQISPRC